MYKAYSGNCQYNANSPNKTKTSHHPPSQNLSSSSILLQLIRVDVSKHLFNLLFIRLVLVTVGDEELGAQEAGDVEDFHLFGLVEVGVSNQLTAVCTSLELDMCLPLPPSATKQPRHWQAPDLAAG